MFEARKIPPENHLASLPTYLAQCAGIPRYVPRPDIMTTAFNVLDNAEKIRKDAAANASEGIDGAKQADFVAMHDRTLKLLVRTLVAESDVSRELGIQDTAGTVLIEEIEEFRRDIP